MLTRGQHNTNNEMNKHWIIVGKITKRYDAIPSTTIIWGIASLLFCIFIEDFFFFFFLLAATAMAMCIFPHGMLFLHTHSHSPNRQRKRIEHWLSILNGHVVLIMLSTCILFPCYCASLSLSQNKILHISAFSLQFTRLLSLKKPSNFAFAFNHSQQHFGFGPFLRFPEQKKNTRKIPNELTMMKIMHVCNVNVHTRIVSISRILFFSLVFFVGPVAIVGVVFININNVAVEILTAFDRREWEKIFSHCK